MLSQGCFGTSLAPEGDIINAQYRLTPCTRIVQAGATYKARGLFNLSRFPHPSGRDLMNAQALDGLYVPIDTRPVFFLGSFILLHTALGFHLTRAFLRHRGSCP